MGRIEAAGEIEHFLRKGRWARPIEVNFNHDHDPDGGRITSEADGGAAKGARARQVMLFAAGPFGKRRCGMMRSAGPRGR